MLKMSSRNTPYFKCDSLKNVTQETSYPTQQIGQQLNLDNSFIIPDYGIIDEMAINIKRFKFLDGNATENFFKSLNYNNQAKTTFKPVSELIQIEDLSAIAIPVGDILMSECERKDSDITKRAIRQMKSCQSKTRKKK